MFGYKRPLCPPTGLTKQNEKITEARFRVTRKKNRRARVNSRKNRSEKTTHLSAPKKTIPETKRRNVTVKVELKSENIGMRKKKTIAMRGSPSKKKTKEAYGHAKA